MEDWNWSTIIVGVLTFVGAVSVQVMIRSGEPRKLKTLRLINEVIENYGSSDEGLEALLDTRKHLAASLSSALATPPWWRRLANGTAIAAVGATVAGVVVAAITAWASVLLSKSGDAPAVSLWLDTVTELFVPAAILTVLALISRFAAIYVRRRQEP